MRLTTSRLVILSFLAAFAVVGRSATSFLPNVQPATAIIVLSGFFLGSLATFLLSIVITFISNMLLGTGIWTIWQMIAWSSVGLLAYLATRLFYNVGFKFIVVYSFIAGYLYGFIISLFTYQVTGKFLPYYLAGLIFDTYHSIGNLIFVIILYPLLKK